jgi:MSHA biogenesis protein MshL
MKPWVPLLLISGLALPAWAQTPATAGPATQAVAPVAAPAAQHLPRLERFDIALVDAPASQVFLQIAQGSPYQLLVGPEVTGKISLNLRQTTLLEALEAIKELYGYDYKIAGDKVYVYSNAVQTRIFRISYLPGRRQG